jgi:hypothetical protein
MSKHFRKEEVIGYLDVDGRKVTYLKTGVHRLRFNDYLTDDYMPQLNQELIHLERWTKFYSEVMGEEDFTND